VIRKKELRLQQQTINELQAQLSQTNEDNRINLETELAEEQDRYRMLTKRWWVNTKICESDSS